MRHNRFDNFAKDIDKIIKRRRQASSRDSNSNEKILSLERSMEKSFETDRKPVQRKSHKFNL